MQCFELENHLQERSGEALSPQARAHLDICARCQALAADFEAIAAAAANLGADEPEPPERIWINVRAQLRAENLIREPQPAPVGFWSGLLAWIPRPALAAAYLAVIVAVGVWMGFHGTEEFADIAAPQIPASTPGAEVIVKVNTDLRNLERRTVAAVRPRPAVSASLRDGLASVDELIALCEMKLREDPQNDLAREYLYGAYQQKAELLATLADHGARGD